MAILAKIVYGVELKFYRDEDKNKMPLHHLSH